MKTITTLSALLFTACSAGLHAGSTFSTSGASGSAPAPTSSTAPSEPSTAPAPSAPAEAPAPSVAPAQTAVSAQPAAALDPLTSRDVDSIDTAAGLLARIRAGTLVPGNGTKESTLRDQVRFCSDQVTHLIKDDYPLTTVMPITDAKATLGEADSTICQALSKAADGWDDRSKQFYAARDDAKLEPYRKAGVSGDKLKLVHDLGVQLIGPGHADPTPAIVARASVLFSVRDEGPRLDGGHDWTIVRYAFSGNKQSSVTEKRYHDHPGPGAYR
jgi:hypothetical protein